MTYCPRLYYLQYVDCVMPTNEHVEAGLHDHRRVDDPDLANKARKDGAAVRTRGVALSSEALGITGVLDQIEERNGEKYPVETKHGTAPRDADGNPTTWDNDAVQLCAQGLLLEEQTGVSVARGVQFYAGTRDRVPVPSRDPVNALLSFAYAMLTKDCFAAACTVGFDPYKGFFHANRRGKPSLALDLMEEFSPLIADSVVLTLVNNEMLTPADFVTWRDACQLTDAGRKKFFASYEQRKSAEVTHPVYGYRMTYGRMLEVQARMLAAFVRGSVPGYTGFTVR